MSRYFTFLKCNLITWRSKKKKIIARSNAHVKFEGITYGVCILLWIKSVFKDLGVEYTKPMNFHCDNKTSIEIA